MGSAAVVVALMGLMLATFGVTQAGAQNAADDPAQLEAGQAVFEANCAACHGADGTGSDRGRLLIGIAGQQPDRAVHIVSVTEGKGNMPAWGDKLSAEEIDAAVSYVRLTFVDSAESSDDALAATGTETPLLAIAGLTLVGAGGLFVHHGRRRR